MAGITTEECGVERSIEGVSSEQRCQSGEALVEWRSSEQVENGTPSTCPPYWDSDDDDDGGPKPAELHGKYTWKIDKFSQINKRELRSNAFDVGGYKWYILIYPQGCDVCNHLSLFLCVANHDKLLPGWSHFAQFTIAVVNKDPKKTKYSDTLHRFWKKEHDWGWKKFIELSKLFDGFIDSDTLIIKAQVQVIRERADRPFRCLNSQYRRELVRVYLTNVEQNCRRFVEERRVKLGELIYDKARWSSFRAFWMGMEQNSKRRMSREKTDSILKVLVKHFFIEKEVTSTLVMDSLYSGLKALEGQYKGKKSKGMYLENEELPLPIVRMEKDTFLLIDDVLTLLERAAVEPLPPKDEKGPQNRTKDGALGEEFNKDSIEREERRLTELGRRTIEIFILAHIFSKIEVAYQEAVALKRQDELIREEEAAWLAEIELKARRGVPDKEKKSKKKQGKQKRNNRKGRDKGRDDKHSRIAQDKIDQDIDTAKRKDSQVADAEPEMIIGNSDAVEDVSDVSDSVECVPEILLPDSEDTDTSEVHPRTETSSSGISALSSVQNGTEERSSSVVDDSSSTCSSDSIPFVAINGSHKVNFFCQKSPNRARNYQSKVTSDQADWVNAEPNQPYKALFDAGHPIDARNSKAVESFSQVADRAVNGAEKHVPKEEETDSLHKSGVSKYVNVEVSRGRASSSAMPLPRSPSTNIPSSPSKVESKDNGPKNHLMVKKSSSESHKQADKSLCRANSSENTTTPKPDTPKFTTINSIEMSSRTQMTTTPSMPVMSRPLSAPLLPGSMPSVSVVPTVQTAPILSRPASTSSTIQSSTRQSYRNVIVGSHVAQNHSTNSGVNASLSYSQVSAPLFSLGMVSQQNVLPRGPLWIESPPERDLPVIDRASLINDMQSLDLYGSAHRREQDHRLLSGRQSHLLPDEFPHLDIINDLLDDEHGIGNLSISNAGYQGFTDGPHYLDRQVSFPGDPSRLGLAMGSCRFERIRSYCDYGFQQSYGASRSTYDMRRDVVPRTYVNCQIDGLVPNQWQMGGSDLPFICFGNRDSDPYRVAEYQNPNVGVNSYTVFRPTSGL